MSLANALIDQKHCDNKMIINLIKATENYQHTFPFGVLFLKTLMRKQKYFRIPTIPEFQNTAKVKFSKIH